MQHVQACISEIVTQECENRRQKSRNGTDAAILITFFSAEAFHAAALLHAAAKTVGGKLRRSRSGVFCHVPSVEPSNPVYKAFFTWRFAGLDKARVQPELS